MDIVTGSNGAFSWIKLIIRSFQYPTLGRISVLSMAALFQWRFKHCCYFPVSWHLCSFFTVAGLTMAEIFEVTQFKLNAPESISKRSLRLAASSSIITFTLTLVTNWKNIKYESRDRVLKMIFTRRKTDDHLNKFEINFDYIRATLEILKGKNIHKFFVSGFEWRHINLSEMFELPEVPTVPINISRSRWILISMF